MANPRRSGSLEYVGSLWRDQFGNLKRRRDHDMANAHSQRAPSIHTDYIGQHHASHNSHNEEVYNLERKVDHLRQCLHRKARIREETTPTPSQRSLRMTEVTNKGVELHLVNLLHHQPI